MAEEVSALEQAKKRDHKIFITENAINSVDYVKLSDFSDKDCVKLQNKHRELLKKSMNDNNSNEVLKICDVSFKSEVDVMGDEFGVYPGQNPFSSAIISNSKNRMLLFLHNHPSTNNFIRIRY